MTLAARLYRTLGRVAPSDVTVVLLLDVRTPDAGPRPSAAPPGITLALLDGATLEARAARGAAGFAEAVPLASTGDTSRCAVALHEGRVVAHAWFARDRVPAAANTGGDGFAGIGLRLPASVAYLFKVHVAPDRRGRGLARAVIAHGCHELGEPFVDAVVTTTDFTNEAFRRSTARLGFERRDWAAELVLGHRHLYLLPPPLPVSGGGSVEFSRGSRG